MKRKYFDYVGVLFADFANKKIGILPKKILLKIVIL